LQQAAPPQEGPRLVAMPEPRGESGTASNDQEHPTVMTASRSLNSAAAQLMPSAAPHDERDIAASPLARRMAYAAGISLSTVRGPGRGGRITKEDVEQLLRPVAPPAAGPRPLASSAARVAPLPQGDEERYQLLPLSTVRRVSAERLTLSKQTIPHFYLRTD